MKHLPIKTEQYIYLEKKFKEWLDILGYAATTTDTLPIHVRELLYHLEQRKITSLQQVKSQHIYEFIRHLKKRPNLTKGGALSSSTINKTIQAVNTFAKFLSANGHHYLDVNPRRVRNHVEERIILTQAEIKALYEATFITERGAGVPYGQRDRAIIAIYYGCGLRKNEGFHLDKDDILIERGVVLVRKGKGRKERFVPIAGKHMEDIQRYLEEGRHWFLEDHRQSGYYKRSGKKPPPKADTDKEAFFLNFKGKRMQEGGFYTRLRKLQERAGIEKVFALHSLRHSIATHLLQSGMELEEIRRFLGHSTLESTQIYTHIINEIKKKEQHEQDELLHIPVK